eukprot:Skav219657  [mRNA]  locus=C8839950:258:731:- [translate_table: standard]
MNGLEDLRSVKDELVDEVQASAAASELSLFPVELVASGAIAIESSSGSDSEDSSSYSSSSESDPPVSRDKAVQFREEVPQGKDYYRHVKSSLIHCADSESKILACGAKLTQNFKLTERVLLIKLPKCIKCFPGTHNRIRTHAEMAEAIDRITKRSKT